jgi:hypothetical protein
MSRRQALWLGILGGAGFLVSCLLVGHGLRDRSLYSDVHVYARYAGEMTAGEVPYRDFFDEYPPLAQPLFLFGRVAGASNYALAFKAAMALCGVAALACAVVTLRALRARLGHAVAAVGAIAAAPLLVGPIFLNAYDLWPAFLLALALALIVRGRPLGAFAVLGAAAAAKVYPLAVLPIAVLAIEARRRRPALLAFAGVLVLAHLPFAILGPGGLRYSYSVQARRGLELNSLGAAVLLAAGHPRLRNETPGSLNVVGGAAHALAVVASLLVLAAIAAAAIAFARGRPLVAAAAAAVAGVVAFDKVFSAQYVDWFVPLVPLAGAVPAALTAVLFALTRLVFSHRAAIQADAGSVWLLLARDLLVVALYVVLLGSWRGRVRPPSAPCRPRPPPAPAAAPRGARAPRRRPS